MGTHAFVQGTAFQLNKTATFRLTRKVGPSLWQAEDLRDGRIQEFTDQELRGRYARRELVFQSAPNLRPKTEVAAIDYSDPRWTKAKVRRAYVKAIEKLPKARSSTLALVIQDTFNRIKSGEAKPPHVATVLRWRKRYEAAGKNLEALIDQTDRKGNRTTRYPETADIVRDLIERRYLTLQRATLNDVADEATVRVTNENRERLEQDQIPKPSVRLVRRLLEKEWTEFDRYAARYGRDAAKNRFRAALGHTITDAPLARAEMDHTRLDLILVNGKGLPLGRPWVTTCIDTYTRCVLGVYVGFEPPSYLTVAKCLKHALMPKTDLREKYPSIKNEWVAHGVMDVLVVDNGLEFQGSNLDQAADGLNITVQYAARKAAWFKGTVERWFRTLNLGLAHRMPGTTYSNILEKGGINPAKEAILELDKFKEILFKWIVDVYHQTPHRGIDKNSPAGYWQKSITPELIKLADDPARLDAVLGASVKRRLTHAGIELNGLAYNSRELQDVRMTHGAAIDVDVRYDPAELGSVVVFNPDDTRSIIVVPALDQEYAAGLSAWQHKMIREHAAKELDKFNHEGWRQAKADILKMVDEELGRRHKRTRTRAARFAGEGKLDGSDASTTADAATKPAGGVTSTGDSNAQAARPAKSPVIDQEAADDYAYCAAKTNNNEEPESAGSDNNDGSSSDTHTGAPPPESTRTTEGFEVRRRARSSPRKTGANPAPREEQA